MARKSPTAVVESKSPTTDQEVEMSTATPELSPEAAEALAEVETTADAVSETTAPDESVTETAEVTETTPVADETPVEEPEAPIDLTAFLASVEAVRTFANEVNGAIADDKLTDVIAEYSKLPGTKAKNAARKALKDQVTVYMRPGPDQVFAKASTNMAILDALKVEKAPKADKAPKAPVDPTQDFIHQFLALVVAKELLSRNVPTGVSEDWMDKANLVLHEKATGEQVQAYGRFLADTSEEAKAPEVADWVVASYKIASGKAGKVRSTKVGGKTITRTTTHVGPNRNVLNHISNAFLDKEVGTFLKVAQIVNTPSTEYGDDRPSSGAVSARIDSKTADKAFGPLGLEVAVVDGAKGLRKVA